MKYYAIINKEGDVDHVVSIEDNQIVQILEFDQFLDSYAELTVGDSEDLGDYSVEEIFPVGEI